MTFIFFLCFWGPLFYSSLPPTTNVDFSSSAGFHHSFFIFHCSSHVPHSFIHIVFYPDIPDSHQNYSPIFFLFAFLLMLIFLNLLFTCVEAIILIFSLHKSTVYLFIVWLSPLFDLGVYCCYQWVIIQCYICAKVCFYRSYTVHVSCVH